MVTDDGDGRRMAIGSDGCSDSCAVNDDSPNVNNWHGGLAQGNASCIRHPSSSSVTTYPPDCLLFVWM